MSYKNRFIKLTALALSTTMILSTNAFAASSLSGDIYVGDVVSISAKDIQVQNNYKSMDEVEREYTKDMENITSGNTSIDSSDGKLNTGNGNSIIDSLFPGSDISGNIPSLPNKQKKTLSYEDFMKLIGDQKSDVKKKFEDARNTAQNKQEQEKKEGAEAIKDAIEKSQKGINPVTGKKDDSETSGNSQNPFTNLAKASDDLKSWLMGTPDPEEGTPTISAEQQKWFNDMVKEMDKKNIQSGNHGLVRNWKRMDQSEYANDTLCYEKDQHNINDIKYKCAKCGKKYAFNDPCDCGKFLLNTIHNSASDHLNNPFTDIGISSKGFASFDDDGTGHTKFVNDVIPMKCKICGKRFTKDSVDFQKDSKNSFLISTNGELVCKECSDKILKITEEEWGGNIGTADGATGQWIKKYMGEGSYDPREMLAYWAEMKDHKKYSSPNDDNNWDIWNPYYDDFIIPVKDTAYDDSTITEGKTFDDLFKEYLEGLPEDQIEEAKKKYVEYKRKKESLKEKVFGAKDNAILDEMLTDYYDALASQKNALPEKGKPAEKWTEDEKKNFQEAAKELLNKGAPDSNYWGSKTEKLKDTKDYDKAVNKVFGEWPADRNLWTDKQKEIYEQFKEKYGKSEGMQGALDDMIKDGVFDKNKTYDQIIKGIDDYIAGFTSINESVTVYVTVDTVGAENHTNKKNYTVQGDILLSILDPKNKSLISDYQITDSIAYRFCPDEAGKYTLKRKVRIYDIEWQIVYQDYDIKVEAQMPDGSTELVSEKQVTRIKEDKSGLKSSNMRELSAPDITVNVKPRTLDIDKRDFYDTERIS